MLRKMFRDKKGQGLVEYGLIIAGVALISAAAISVFGHKTNDLIAAVAAVLPGAHAEDNNPIFSGSIIETGAEGPDGSITLDVADILNHSGESRLAGNVLGNDELSGFGGLIIDGHDHD
jgi:pilus assembly protein Flp/PilA